MIEVPYIPRARVKRRRRLFPSGKPFLVIAGLFVAAVVILIAARIVYDSYQRRSLQRHLQQIATRLEQARQFDSSGRLEEAFAEAERAVAYAREQGIAPPLILNRRRDQWALRLARRELDAIDSHDPDSALVRAEALHAWCARDPALAPIAGLELEALARCVERVIAQEDAEASAALDRAEPIPALRAARRLRLLARHLDPVRAEAVLAQADELAASVARQHGLRLRLTQGQFRLGSLAAYQQSLNKYTAAILSVRGYIPEQLAGDFRELWLELAPYMLDVQVTEGTVDYLQSNLHAARINVSLTLLRGDVTIWQNRFTTRTRMPPPNMSTMEAGRLAAATDPNPAAEKRFHEDAFRQVEERWNQTLSLLPAVPPLTPRGGGDSGVEASQSR